MCNPLRKQQSNSFFRAANLAWNPVRSDDCSWMGIKRQDGRLEFMLLRKTNNLSQERLVPSVYPVEVTDS
jgi:hypothetical protein